MVGGHDSQGKSAALDPREMPRLLLPATQRGEKLYRLHLCFAPLPVWCGPRPLDQSRFCEITRVREQIRTPTERLMPKNEETPGCCNTNPGPVLNSMRSKQGIQG